MNDNNNKSLIYVVIGLAVFLVAVVFGGNFVMDKIANKVIIKLQKEYSPSPYGPGLDPDKIDPEKIRNAKP